MENQRTRTHDFIIKQGVTFKRRFRFKIDGITQSLDGSVVRIFARPISGDPITLLSSDLPSSDQYVTIDTTDPDDNFIEWLFSETITDSFLWTYATYRLDLIDSLDVVRRKLKGRLIIEPETN